MLNSFQAITGHLHLPQETLKLNPPHHLSNTLLGRYCPCQYLSELEVGSGSGSHLIGPTEYTLEQGRREEEAEAPWREKLAETGDVASLRQMFGAQRALCTDEIQTYIKGVIGHDHRAEG